MNKVLCWKGFTFKKDSFGISDYRFFCAVSCAFEYWVVLAKTIDVDASAAVNITARLIEVIL
jgi:hypothetical protein